MRSSKLWKKSKKIIGLVVLVAILYIAGNIISICTYSTRDERCEADVAIILGAATYNGEVSPVYRERLKHGVTLYQQGFVAKIIVTGGLGEGNTESDASIAKGYQTAVIVSDSLHMKRSMLLAKDAGIVAYSLPTPTTMYVSWRTKIPFLAREVFLYVGYKWWRIL